MTSDSFNLANIKSKVLRQDLLYWKSHVAAEAALRSAEIDCPFDEVLIASKKTSPLRAPPSFHKTTLKRSATSSSATLSARVLSTSQSTIKVESVAGADSAQATGKTDGAQGFGTSPIQQSFFLVNSAKHDNATIVAVTTKRASVGFVDTAAEVKVEQEPKQYNNNGVNSGSDRGCSKCRELHARQAQLEGTIAALVTRLEMKK